MFTGVDLNAAFAVVALLLSAAAPSVKALNAACIAGVHEVSADDAFILPLAYACTNSLGPDRSGMWNSKLCVAAGVSAGIEQLNDLANCGATATVLGPTQFPSLDYSVYASIVGSCAYETDGCPVTEQNLVDLVYGQIAEANLTTWPMSRDNLVSNYIAPIFWWTKFNTTEGVPYLNFNDWLHYSGYTNHEF